MSKYLAASRERRNDRDFRRIQVFIRSLLHVRLLFISQNEYLLLYRRRCIFFIMSFFMEPQTSSRFSYPSKSSQFPRTLEEIDNPLDIEYYNIKKATIVLRSD